MSSFSLDKYMGMLKAGKDMTKDSLLFIRFIDSLKNGSLHMDLLLLQRQCRPGKRLSLRSPCFQLQCCSAPDLIRATFKLLHCLSDAFLSVVFVKIIPNLCAHVEFKSNDGCAVPTIVPFSLPAPVSGWPGGSCIWSESQCIKTSLLATPRCALI